MRFVSSGRIPGFGIWAVNMHNHKARTPPKTESSLFFSHESGLIIIGFAFLNGKAWTMKKSNGQQQLRYAVAGFSSLQLCICFFLLLLLFCFSGSGNQKNSPSGLAFFNGTHNVSLSLR